MVPFISCPLKSDPDCDDPDGRTLTNWSSTWANWKTCWPTAKAAERWEMPEPKGNHFDGIFPAISSYKRSFSSMILQLAIFDYQGWDVNDEFGYFMMLVKMSFRLPKCMSRSHYLELSPVTTQHNFTSWFVPTWALQLLPCPCPKIHVFLYVKTPISKSQEEHIPDTSSSSHIFPKKISQKIMENHGHSI